MKKYLKIIIYLIVVFILYYIFLPPINLLDTSFYTFIILILFILMLFNTPFDKLINIKKDSSVLIKSKQNIKIFAFIFIIIIGIFIINIFASPIFHAKSYSNRITIDETHEFTEDIKEVDFNKVPLLDKDSSTKLGDRVMGQNSKYVSQYNVSSQYSQINYNNEIIRVTPLEYADIFKWFSNKDKGINAYITVNSVNGSASLVKLEKGMKIMPSAYFNNNLKRYLRFKYPTLIFGNAKFEIDNDKNPYWIVPIKTYSGIGIKEEIKGVIVLDPISGKTHKYEIDDIPSWIDNVYYADLIIEEIDDWGQYKNGFLNSLFGQKDVVRTTTGYNYLVMNDDVYLYTGITSSLADESNLGFTLTNLRTKETRFYSVAGAEEYSAMASAEGQVQQMDYTSTFPLLINLNNRPTYLMSLKDNAGLVKMYAFVDVEDYQKVMVIDSSATIEEASKKYIDSFDDNKVDETSLIKKDIIVRSIKDAVINSNTYYFIEDENNNKYKVNINVSDKLAFINVNDTITIGYKEENEITQILKIY